jgi:hypothetical protein
MSKTSCRISWYRERKERKELASQNKTKRTNLQNHPPHLASSLGDIDGALIERIRRDSKQLGRQFDRATEFVLGFGRFALLSNQRLGSLEEMAGVGVGHDVDGDGDVTNARSKRD